MIWDTVVTRRKKKWTAQVNTPDDLVPMFSKKERSAQQEMFWLVTVNAQNVPTGKFLISIGSLRSTTVHPREVMYSCVTVQAAGFFVAHNHPSGDLKPSKDDIEMTERLQEVGKLLGIPLIDSLIITNDNYVSFKGKGIVE